MTLKILITGSREFHDEEVMRSALNAAVTEFGPSPQIIVIHGAARGADSLADKLAVASSAATVVRVPADWENLERWEAGPRRNGHMLDLGPDVVLAFYRTGAANRGTANCVKQARDRDIPVREYFA